MGSYASMYISDSIIQQYGLHQMGYYNFVENYHQGITQTCSVVAGKTRFFFSDYSYSVFLSRCDKSSWPGSEQYYPGVSASSSYFKKIYPTE